MRIARRITTRLTIENATLDDRLGPPVPPGFRRVVADIRTYSCGYPSRWRVEAVYVDEELPPVPVSVPTPVPTPVEVPAA